MDSEFFTLPLWWRIIPSSWDTFRKAWHALRVYLSFQKPGPEHFQPYDALQTLGYAA